eukprot:41285_1
MELKGTLCNNIQRIYWICNESVPTYNVIDAGSECVCCWGINIESKLACNSPQKLQTIQQKHKIKIPNATPCNSANDITFNKEMKWKKKRNCSEYYYEFK